MSHFHNISKTIFTTLSALVGGLTKALSFPDINISVSKIIEVALFAAISAVVGYLVKCLLDRIIFSIRKKNIKNRRP